METVLDRPRPQLQLIETDGEPLETPWHRVAIAILIDAMCVNFRGRTDYFVGGNMFLYYTADESRQRKFRGPDFFFVDEVDGLRRRQWWAACPPRDLASAYRLWALKSKAAFRETALLRSAALAPGDARD